MQNIYKIQNTRKRKSATSPKGDPYYYVEAPNPEIAKKALKIKFPYVMVGKTRKFTRPISLGPNMYTSDSDYLFLQPTPKNMLEDRFLGDLYNALTVIAYHENKIKRWQMQWPTEVEWKKIL